MKSNKPLRVLGLVLARGGSKRLPGKNIRLLQGRPLVAWSIDASLRCAAICQTVVSTDSADIAAIALAAGAQVPFMRPAALAEDHSTSADAALHAIDYLERVQSETFDAVVLLEPTSPLRADGDLDGVIQLLADRWDETDAVVSVGAVRLEQPEHMKRLARDGFILPWLSRAAAGEGAAGSNAWFPYGVAYAIKVAALQHGRTFYPSRVLGYPIERWQNYEVDDELDFICIDSIMGYRKEKTS
jgi:CMP-N,N'-diacetyllegionaminic acid synthase